MAKIAIIGATGYAGGHIATEALARNIAVIGVARHAPEQIPAGMEFRTGSIDDTALVAELAQTADALVIAVHGADESGKAALATESLPNLLKAAADGNARLGIVGGAGSLQVAPGGPRVVDTPEFPAAFKSEALAHAQVLDALKAADTKVDWFYVSPAGGFGSYTPGTRTGSYRLGDDVLVTDAEGNSAISGADFAIAFVDELENPAHHQARFTVAY